MTPEEREEGVDALRAALVMVINRANFPTELSQGRAVPLMALTATTAALGDVIHDAPACEQARLLANCILGMIDDQCGTLAAKRVAAMLDRLIAHAYEVRDDPSTPDLASAAAH